MTKTLAYSKLKTISYSDAILNTSTSKSFDYCKLRHRISVEMNEQLFLGTYMVTPFLLEVLLVAIPHSPTYNLNIYVKVAHLLQLLHLSTTDTVICSRCTVSQICGKSLRPTTLTAVYLFIYSKIVNHRLFLYPVTLRALSDALCGKGTF